METIINILRGIGFGHVQVGAARGLLEGAVLGAISGLFVAFSGLDFKVLGLPEFAIPLILWGYPTVRRTMEGWADKIDPSTPRNPNA